MNGPEEVFKRPIEQTVAADGENVNQHNNIVFRLKAIGGGYEKSIFEKIPGMGKKRIQKLWQEFESLEAIEKSSLQEIVGRTGFSKKLSSAILECAGRKT